MARVSAEIDRREGRPSGDIPISHLCVGRGIAIKVADLVTAASRGHCNKKTPEALSSRRLFLVLLFAFSEPMLSTRCTFTRGRLGLMSFYSSDFFSFSFVDVDLGDTKDVDSFFS